MQEVDNLAKRARDYPKHQIFQDAHPYMLEVYFDQLNEFERNLFQGLNASINFWECLQSGQCKYA